MDDSPAKRVTDYREHADQVRKYAAEMQDEASRMSMLKTAALWDRMADLEERMENTGAKLWCEGRR